MTARGILVGLGNIARQSHLPAFQDPAVADRLVLAATVDPAVADGVPGLPHFKTLEAAIAAVQPDFIDVCTPTAFHASQSRVGLEAGCHVLCEKPVALSLAEVDELSQLARSRGRILAPCHQYRFNPAWRQLRRWLDDGVIGRWHLAEFHVYRPGADRGADPAAVPWRARREQSRGGILLDHGTHLIYQLVDVAGMPRSVMAWNGILQHQAYDVEDTTQMLLDFGDRLGSFFLTWAADRRDTRIRFIGEDGSVEWTGGMLRRSGRHGEETLDFAAQLDKRNYFRWFAELFLGFADAIDRQDPEPSLADLARVTRILESAYLAHEGAGRVRL